MQYAVAIAFNPLVRGGRIALLCCYMNEDCGRGLPTQPAIQPDGCPGASDHQRHLVVLRPAARRLPFGCVTSHVHVQLRVRDPIQANRVRRSRQECQAVHTRRHKPTARYAGTRRGGMSCSTAASKQEPRPGSVRRKARIDTDSRAEQEGLDGRLVGGGRSWALPG